MCFETLFNLFNGVTFNNITKLQTYFSVQQEKCLLINILDSMYTSRLVLYSKVFPNSNK